MIPTVASVKAASVNVAAAAAPSAVDAIPSPPGWDGVECWLCRGGRGKWGTQPSRVNIDLGH